MRPLLPLLLASTLFAAPISATTAIFANAPTIRMEGYADDIRAADFDHDQKLDFAVVRSVDATTTRLSVYLGSGGGLFRDPIVSDFTHPAGSTHMAVADLDGDGFPDLVFGAGTSLQTLLGKGNGTFNALSPLPQSRSCSSGSLILADMTSDGRLDIVTCGELVFPSLGGGNFGPPILTGTSFGGQLLVLDANGDGKLDVFDGDIGNSNLLLGNGDGTFHRDASLPYTFSETAAAADFDGNGRDDLTFIDARLNDRVLMLASPAGDHAARTSQGFVALLRGGVMITTDLNGDARPDVVAGDSSHFYVWLTRPDGLSFAPTVYLSSNVPRNIIAGDFDSDGKTDLLVQGQADSANSGYPPTDVTLIRGVGDGTLRAERGYALPSRLYGTYESPNVMGMTLSDLTGDGLLDLVTSTDWTIEVLPGGIDGTFGTPITTALDPIRRYGYGYFGDLNRDGAVDVVTSNDRNSYECWLGSRAGTFRRVYSFPIDGDGKGAIGDFDGDGNLDFARVGSEKPQMWPGHGDGTFGSPIVTATPVYTEARWPVRVADINADGRDDLVTDRMVLLGLSTRQFEQLIYTQDGSEATVGDLDGDGHLDLVRVDRVLETIQIRRGHGDGTFFDSNRWLNLLTERAAAPSVVADFDGDGDLDVSFGTAVLQGDGHAA